MIRPAVCFCALLTLLAGGVEAQSRPERSKPSITIQKAPVSREELVYQRALRDAKNLVRRGDYEGALASLDRIEEPWRREREVLVLRGASLRKLGRYDEACRLYRAAVDSMIGARQDPASMLIELERAYRERKDPETAFAVCLELHRGGDGIGVWVRDEMESLIEADGLGERALPLLQKEIARRPGAEDLRDLRIGALLFLGRFAESLQETIRLDRDRGARGTVLLEQVRLMDKKGIGEPALTTVDAAIAEGIEGEGLQEALFLRAAALRRLRRPAEAAEAYRGAAAVSPDGSLARVALRDRADLLVRDLGDLDAGARAYEELIASLEGSPRERQGPLLAAAMVALADCHLRIGRYEEAGEVLARVEEEQTDPASKEEVVFQQAEILFYAGSVEQARAGYDRVVKEFAGGIRVNDSLERILLLTRCAEAGALPLAALGQIAYQRRVGSPERALEISLEVSKECGDCPAAEDLLREESLTLLDLDRIEEAAERADTLAARFADSGSAPTLLLEVAHRMRERDGEAEAVLKRYEDLVIRFPKSPEAFEVRALLQDLRKSGNRLRERGPEDLG